MRKLYALLSLLVWVCVLGSCNKFDKPEKVASYLYIPKINLTVGPTQGTSASEILDAWVYVNDQPLGVFGLPCLVPILESGEQKITIYAGIKDDGINESRNKYAFYQPYIKTINLQPGIIDTLNGADAPTVSYYPGSDIEIWNENFDDASVNFVAETNSDAGITYIDDSVNAYEGGGMGKIELTGSMTFARVYTSQTFLLPKAGKPVYVEINYKTNNTMAVGIKATNGTEVKYVDNTIIKPSNGLWKKMYVNLREAVSNQAGTQFNFIITVSKDDGITTVENFIDNFKVVYAK